MAQIRWAKPERWLWTIAALGVVLRVRAWLEGRSLWLDESFLAVNLLDTDLWALISQRMENNQSAPPGFLTLSWLSIQVFGQNDYSVRLVPLVFGSLVPLAAVMVARIFTSQLAKFSFVTFAALSPVLVFYSAEFKQYSIDVLASMMVIYWWANWERLKTSRWLIVGGAVLALCSLTAILVMVLLCLAVLVAALRRNHGESSWRDTFFAEFRPSLIVTWSAAILLHLIQAVLVTPAGFMLLWWSGKDAFAPLPTTLDGVLWYPLSFLKLFFIGFATSASAGPGPELGYPQVWIAGATLVAIAIALKSRWLALPLMALAAAYLLAALRLYPLSSRLALYLLPFVFLLVALALESSKRVTRKLQLQIVAVPLLAILVTISGLAAYRFVNPTDYRDFKWGLASVEQNASPDQILAIDDSVSNQFNWYQHQGISVSIPVVVVPFDWDQMRHTDTSALVGANGVWTLAALGGPDQEVRLRGVLEELDFVQVCYVFEDFASVALHVPVELAKTREWDCQFPQHN